MISESDGKGWLKAPTLQCSQGLGLRLGLGLGLGLGLAQGPHFAVQPVSPRAIPGCDGRIVQ